MKSRVLTLALLLPSCGSLDNRSSSQGPAASEDEGDRAHEKGLRGGGRGGRALQHSTSTSSSLPTPPAAHPPEAS